MTPFVIALFPILAAWMAFLARQAGGGAVGMWLVYHAGTKYGAFWGSAASRVPEAIWAISICTLGSIIVGGYGWYFLPILIFNYFCMEFGHGNAQYDYPDRWQTPLDNITRPLLRGLVWVCAAAGLIISIPPRSKWYCRIFMGIKGILIGLPLFPLGLLLAFFWPLSYAIGFRYLKSDSAPAEIASGIFTGLIMATIIAVG